MTKNTTRGILMLVIVLAVFSAIAFVIPFPQNTVFWIAYACGIFAILFQLYIFKSSFGKEDARSRFYGFPIARLGIYYLVIQLIVSIARQDAKLKKNVSNMRELQSISLTLAGQCSDEEMKKTLQKLADEFRYSDPLSSEKTEELEADMHSRIGDLQQAITDGDIEGGKSLCYKLLECLRERNRICSLNK